MGESGGGTTNRRHPGTSWGSRPTPAASAAGPSMAYVTDNELGAGGHYDGSASWGGDFGTFLKGGDLLLHDAMYTPKELEQHRRRGHPAHQETVTLAQ